MLLNNYSLVRDSYQFHERKINILNKYKYKDTKIVKVYRHHHIKKTERVSYLHHLA